MNKKYITKKIKELVFQLFLEKMKNKFKNVKVVSRSRSQLVLRSKNKMINVKHYMRCLPLSFIIDYSEEFEFNGDFFIVVKFNNPKDHQLRWVSEPLTQREIDAHEAMVHEWNWGNWENIFKRVYNVRELDKALVRFNLTIKDIRDSLNG